MIYTNAGNYSQATVAVPNTGGASTSLVYVPFNSFTIGAGSGANFSNVGAMVMKITGNAAVNGQVSGIADVGSSVFTANFGNYQTASVGTFAFWDANSDGLRDNGDPARPMSPSSSCEPAP